MSVANRKANLEHDPPQQAVLGKFDAEGSGPWILAYAHWESGARGLSGGQYACFLSAARASKAVTHPGWDLQYDSSRPGFSQSFAGGRTRTRYEKPGADGIEALVHVRFIPDRPTQFEKIGRASCRERG